MNKAFVSILNELISVRPLEASPNQIVLVGRSRKASTASFHACLVILPLITYKSIHHSYDAEEST